MKLRVKFRTEDLRCTYWRYFWANLLFWWSIFDGTNIHGIAIIERPLYRRFLHNDHLPYFQQNFSAILSAFFPSFRSSHWRCSVRKGVLRNFAKFTRKRLWQSLFFNKDAGWGNCFWSFLCLLLKISCLFHFNRKMKYRKGNTLMEDRLQKDRQVVYRVTTSDTEWQRMVQRVTTNDNEWQRLTTSGTTNNNKWQRVISANFSFFK